MCPFGIFSRKTEPSVAQEPHRLALSVAREAAPVGYSRPFVVGNARLYGFRTGGRRLARCGLGSAPVVVPAVRASPRRASSVPALSANRGRLLPLSGLGYTARSNLSINPTAKKLRFLVPSALRAPAAGYLQR